MEDLTKLEATEAETGAVARTKRAEFTAAAAAAATKAEEETIRAGEAKKMPGVLEDTKQAEKVAALGAAQVKQLEAEAEKRFSETTLGQHVITQLNLAEQGKKAAEEFVKELQSADLAKQYDQAAEQMNVWLKQGADYLKQRMEEANKGIHGSFVAALGASQKSKRQEEETGLRRRQAEDAAHDAFVYKPRYGTTSASTAFAEYSKSQMDEYRRLERVAAYKKVTDTFVHLNEQKESGDLSVDQEAQLDSATSFLTEEAWIDDQGEDGFNMLKSLQKGDLKKDPEEQKKWQSMARMLAKVGWVKDKQETDASGKIVTKKAFDTAGNLTADAVLPDTYR